MTDLERRALLGDREAQEECTRQGIVLPCPFCGEDASISLNTVYGFCPWCNNPDCTLNDLTHGYKDEKAALAAWNTRQSPPLVRCRECRYWDRLDEFSDGYCENPMGIDDVTQPGDFCSYGERKENRP